MKDMAVCKYCGQAFYCDEAKTQDDLDRYAVMHCQCNGAQTERARIITVENAKEQLREVFEFDLFGKPENMKFDESFDKIRQQIEKLLEFMVDYQIVNLSVAVAGLGKIALSVNADGAIKIKRTVSNSIERKV